MPARVSILCRLLVAASLSTVFASLATPAFANLPEIRTHAQNRVPACVTPDRLMAFLRTRNESLAPKFADIAAHYKRHGEALRVRWDYAFFQMLLETNYLMFRRGDGTPGDVSISQNNFAGIGATGGGVPGDRFRDVSSGVLAQMQHLVVYSGERVESPIAPRTEFAQDHILSVSLALRRPVTFTDLRNRWAADRNYARSMTTIAERFNEDFCKPLPPTPVAVTPRRVAEFVPSQQVAAQQAQQAPLQVPAPRPATRPSRRVAVASIPAEQAVVAPSRACRVLTASYGGRKTVLIRAEMPAETQFTALTLVEGFERSMVENYVKSRAPGGQAIGEFGSSEAAMSRARELCPGTT